MFGCLTEESPARIEGHRVVLGSLCKDLYPTEVCRLSFEELIEGICYPRKPLID